MIQDYFIKGLTYDWAAPKEIHPPVMDGSIVGSGLDAPPALTYTGMHGEIIYGALERFTF